MVQRELAALEKSMHEQMVIDAFRGEERASMLADKLTAIRKTSGMISSLITSLEHLKSDYAESLDLKYMVGLEDAQKDLKGMPDCRRLSAGMSSLIYVLSVLISSDVGHVANVLDADRPMTVLLPRMKARKTARA